MTDYEYLFGPVPSRRLGRSLGVDLTPFKTCSLDCIFCQLGRTTVKTVERGEYVPTESVISELEDWIDAGGRADYITLSGSGEPTLHSRFGEVLQYIKSKTDIPAALLSNGTMMSLPEVRGDACAADMVKLTLSVQDQNFFEYINRPHPQLDFSQMFSGMKAFREQFEGELWLEVFLIWGVNSTQADAEKIAALAREIRPDRIQLNTAVRPPAEEFASALPRDLMQGLANYFDPAAEVIAEFSPETPVNTAVDENTILAMLRRRPCTAEKTAEVFGMHLNEVSKYIGRLMRTGRINAERINGSVFYTAEKRERTVR